jgi:hypothetical protein
MVKTRNMLQSLEVTIPTMDIVFAYVYNVVVLIIN